MKISDDIINWSGEILYKPKGLADHVAKRIANGGMERYKESSRRWGLCPIELAQSIEDSGFYASDSYGKVMRIFKRVNARGKLNAEYTEVTQKTLHISYGSEPHRKLVDCPTSGGEYIGNESFGNKSLGFELTASKLKKIIREGYSVNPPIFLSSEGDDFLNEGSKKAEVTHVERKEDSSPVAKDKRLSTMSFISNDGSKPEDIKIKFFGDLKDHCVNNPKSMMHFPNFILEPLVESMTSEENIQMFRNSNE